MISANRSCQPDKVRRLRRLFLAFFVGFGFYGPFRLFAFGFAFVLRACRIGCAFLTLLALLVTFASVVGLVESGPLEYYTCACPDKSFQTHLFTP